MARRIVSILACIALLFLAEPASGANSQQTYPEVLSNAGSITIPFVENRGQLEDLNTLFYSNTFAGRVTVNSDGSIGYCMVGKKTGQQKQLCEIRERLSGGLKPSPAGGRPAVAKISHFQGKDPKKWLRNLSTYHTVDMGEIYPGVRMTLKAHRNNVEKIFHVHPGTDSKKIQLTIDGAKTLKLTSKGDLQVDTDTGSMRFTRPVAYQLIDGIKTPVDVAYTVKDRSYGFKLAAYDTAKELIIDPLITAVFEGSTETYSRADCMATDSNGNIYVAGRSAGHLVVLKFDSKLETLLTSTFFGTKNKSEVHAIAIDGQGVIYIAGGTTDENFPVTEGAFDTEYTVSGWSTEASDGFVIKYNSDLNTILAATYIGAGNLDTVFGLAVAPTGNVYVAGETANPVSNPNGDIAPFPTTEGAYDRAPGSFRKTKAFIAQLDNDLQNLLAATLLGDTGDDDQLIHCAYEVAIDTNGNVVVAGGTQSKNFPVTDNCTDAKFQGV